MGCAGPTKVPVPTLECHPQPSGNGPSRSGAVGAVISISAVPGTTTPSLSVTGFTTSRTAFDLGLATILNVTPSGGVGPFTYSYSGFPSGCSGPNTSTISCTPLQVGNDTVRVHVVDSLGDSANGTVSFSVHPDPSVRSFTTSYAVVTLGTSTMLSVAIGNGTAPFSYTYTGLPAGCTSPDSPQSTCLATKAGAFEIRVNATDANEFRATKEVFLLVNPPPKILSFAADPATLTLGNGTNLTVDVFGGTGPFRYTYTGLPPGCSSANATTVACHPARTGNFSVTVTATDVFGSPTNSSIYVDVVGNSTGPVPGGPLPSAPTAGLPTFLGALLGAIAAGAVVGAVVGRRRTRARPPEAA